MQIIPMRDLKNTAQIEKRCAMANEPIYVTKNGYGRLVVMDIDYYERTMRMINDADQINRGISDYEKGHTVDGKSSLENMRARYGI